MRLRKVFKEKSSALLFIGVLILPAVLYLVDMLVKFAGFPQIIPMSVGEYAAYIGTAGVIVWAAYQFSAERRERERANEKKERLYRPELVPDAIDSLAVLVENKGAFPAINVTNCGKSLVQRLEPQESVLLVLDKEKYAELSVKHPDALLLEDYVFGTSTEKQFVLYAYSIHGKEWRYEMSVDKDCHVKLSVWDG